MVAYKYSFPVAWFRGSGPNAPINKAANASIMIYAPSDTGFTTPLTAYADKELTSIQNIVTDSDGVGADFYVDNLPDIVWVSGANKGDWATSQSRTGLRGPTGGVGPAGPMGPNGAPGLNGAGTNAEVAAYVPASGPTRDALDARYVQSGTLNKASVGLANADNTADTAKPVSTAQASAIAAAGTALAAPNTVMRRDANGRTAVATPATASDISTKGYVDSSLMSLGLDVWPANIGAKIGFVGDSNMSGYGLANPATERWPKKFATMAGAVEQNLAVPSAGYINQGSGGASKFANQASLLAADCTHVIINGGINDAPLTYTVAAIQAEVTATINAVRTAAPAARITVISPFWMASAPSDGVLRVDAEIRPAIPADVRYIEGGPWMRVDRTDWQQGDGHPNVTGAAAIAAWLRDQFGGTPRGPEFAEYIIAGTADVLLSTKSSTTPIAYTVAGGSLWGAKSGWWELEGQLVLYTAANGFIWVAEQSRKIRLRADVQGGAPLPYRVVTRFYHPGGDLAIKVGYDPSSGAAQIVTSAQSKVTARWLGAQP